MPPYIYKSKMTYRDPQDPRVKEVREKFRTTHTEEIATYKKQYDQDRNAKTACGCGGIFAFKHRAKHYRTDMHQAYEALAKLQLSEY
jgi:hypothetical protein